MGFIQNFSDNKNALHTCCGVCVADTMPYTLHFAISFSNPDVLSYASSYETGAVKIRLSSSSLSIMQ